MFKRIIITVLIILFTANMAIAWACDKSNHELPPAPDAVHLINEGHDMWFYYKLYYDDNGHYMTAHVLKPETGILPDENGDVEYFEFPIFYYWDKNGNGKFEESLNEIWIDPEWQEADAGNCKNIKIYNVFQDE
ncbi:MAG: hypothetical protein HYV52_01200 [Parcubacteria group bacterium]|nr:hypothetical protein [Parcubacteria group bacterium]